MGKRFSGGFVLCATSFASLAMTVEAQLISSTEMWRHSLAHQLQRTHDFVDGKSAAAIDLSKDAAKPERASQLRKPLYHGIRRPDDDLLTQDIRV
jgi:hypothetical protein